MAALFEWRAVGEPVPNLCLIASILFVINSAHAAAQANLLACIVYKLYTGPVALSGGPGARVPRHGATERNSSKMCNLGRASGAAKRTVARRHWHPFAGETMPKRIITARLSLYKSDLCAS